MNAEKKKWVEMIDRWVKETIAGSSGRDEEDERLLEGMADYMEPFKRVMSRSTPLEMNLLINKYEGFYRFANLLERLAQGIQDGVISAPLAGMMGPPQKKTARRPKPKVKRKKSRPESKVQIRRDISFLPTFTEIIIGELAQTEEQYQTFVGVKHRPHVLDDGIVDRAINLYEGQLSYVALHEKQLSWWLSEKLSPAQRYQVEDLKGKLPLLQAKTEQLLSLLTELSKGTIDRILEMDDEELGRKMLGGEIPPPF